MVYLVELKIKALDYLDECGNLSQVATAFGVDRGTIRAWVGKKQLQAILRVVVAIAILRYTHRPKKTHHKST